MSQEPSLKRVIGFWGITFYGLGGIIGAGIFATIGAIGGRAGLWAPFAFMIASIPALFAAPQLWRIGAPIAQGWR